MSMSDLQSAMTESAMNLIKLPKKMCLLLILSSLLTGSLIGDACAGLVLSGTGYTDYQATVLKQAAKLVEESKLSEAKKLLQKLRGEKTDLLAPDVLLFELLASASQPERARQILENYSFATGPSFDVFFAFSKYAVSQGRWFDAFMHAKLALNQEMPSDWSPGFKAAMREEVYITMLQSCEGRSAWATSKQVLGELEIDEKSDPRLLNYAGKTAFHSNEMERARKYFEQAIAGQESRPPVELVFARLFDSIGSAVEADKNYQTAVRSTKGEPRAAIALEYCRWLVGQGRGSDAERLLGRLDSDPLRDEVTLVTATAQRLQGKYTEAVATLEPLLHKHEDSFMISNELSLALSQLGGRESTRYALRLAEENVGRYPQQLDAWSTYGWLQILTGDLAGAKESLSKAAQSGNISRDTAYFIHRMHKLDGNTAAAQQFLQAAKSGKGPYFFATQAN